jgi:TolB-like protein
LRHRAGAAMTAASVAMAAIVGYVLLVVLPYPRTMLQAGGSDTSAVSNKSIAVLPFVDMSEKHDQEYFSDGLSEELIDHLSHSADLKVIARTSSFAFKGKNDDVRTIASKLGVAHLLEGSVRKAGNELRVTAQLIRAADGTHLWSQTYDRTLADIFKLQDEIAETVARSLKAALNAGAGSKAREVNLDAYNSLLQGQYFALRGNPGDPDRAIEYYKKATELDPGYALAWTRLAGAYTVQAELNLRSRAEVESKARDAAKRALEIDPNSAEAHASLAEIHRDFDWDWPAAQLEFERAISLDPSSRPFYDPRHDNLALASLQAGRIEELIQYEIRTVERDPLNTLAVLNLAMDQLATPHPEDAIPWAKKLLELNPSMGGPHAIQGAALFLMGRNAEALAETEKEPGEGDRLQFQPCIYWALGRRADSDKALALLKKYSANVASPSFVADAYACRGELDAAFEWLERAYQMRDPGLTPLRGDPLLRGLHNDPRYQALLVKMKLND